MNIRTCTAADLPQLIDLTVETFRPFYEDYVRSLLGAEIFQHQHGNWEQDYHVEVPTLHDPAAGQFVAVAETDGAIVGLVAWNVGEKPNHGVISLLAVSAAHRSERIGYELCNFAIERMKSAGVEVVGVGTGDDAFHSAARHLYEGLGFTKIPVAAYLKRI
jgi:ribosomal protein S18 acetylase RimI-like enzyme